MDFFYSNIEKYRSEFKKMITIMLEREKDVGIIISYYNKEIDAWNLTFITLQNLLYLDQIP